MKSVLSGGTTKATFQSSGWARKPVAFDNPALSIDSRALRKLTGRFPYSRRTSTLMIQAAGGGRHHRDERLLLADMREPFDNPSDH